jgi:AraC family transcriptional regulator of arabinose operon
MISLRSIHFDNRIPGWRNHMAVLQLNILALVMDGKIRYTINDSTVIAEKGDLLFIPRGSTRASENIEGEHQKITIAFHHDESDAADLPFLGPGMCRKCKIRNFEYVKHRFERLYDESIGQGGYRQYVVNGIFRELLGMAAREFEHTEVTPIKLKLVHALQQHLAAHYREPVQIARLAALVHRSPNYTISLFRELTGLSPIQYVHLLRIKEACNLLANSDLTVTEIANYLGYYDHSYFFRMFRKITSMSPTTYKETGPHPQNLQLF